MAKLPQKLPLELLETRWASLIEPTLNSPLATPVLLQNVVLASGSNTISHRLGKKLTGWIVTRRNNASTIYDTQSANPLPELTLLLTASGSITVDLLVF